MIGQCFEDGTLCRGFDRFSLTHNECIDLLNAHGTIVLESFLHGSIPLNLGTSISFSSNKLAAWNGSYNQLSEDLQGLYAPDRCGVILAGTDKSAKNLVKNLTSDGYNAVFSENIDSIQSGKRS